MFILLSFSGSGFYAGSKIYAEARKVDGPRVIVKTGRHRAQSITLVENAKAVIIKKLKYVPEG